MAVLKNAIQALDPQPDKTKEITLALSLLSELCEQKIKQYKSDILDDIRTAGSPENKSIPITEIIASHSEYRAYVKDDAGKIATEVSSAIKKFVAGGVDKIIDGMASLVTTGIEAIVGAGEGSQQELSSYYIIVQNYGIARYDIKVWARKIEAKGITSKIQDCLAIAAFKSSVDVSKISFNTFLIAYDQQLSLMNIPQSDIDTYITKAETLYHKLRGDKDSLYVASGLNIGESRRGSQAIGAPLFHGPGVFKGSLWQ